MTRAVLLTSCLMLSLACATGPEAKRESVNHTDETPPLIDREIFFDDPEITGAALSPNGEFISFIKPYKGVRNVWVKRRSLDGSSTCP